MKNYNFKYSFLAVLMLFLFSTFTTSCSSDSSENCLPITCLNNGVSNSDCGCDCPEGYTGENCGTQLIPSKINITKIVIRRFSNLAPDNDFWDADITNDIDEQPDIFPRIVNSSNSLIYLSPVYYNNAISLSDNGNNYSFTIQPNIEITDLSQNYFLGLWDYDGATSELMGASSFNIFNPSQGFPEKITVSQSTTSFQADIYLSYQF